MNNTNIAGEEPAQFSAFISYSHADAAQVRKLHSQLEAYRLPKGLGEIDTLNRTRGGLGRVFRDREDLSASESLSAAVTDALDRSEVLVVVCSPDAKASHWVGQEIAYFREHQPDRPILAAIVAGEPEEAFPDALTEGGAEPLAADLRKQGDGWKLGFLKVVAGIAGVPLDALIQRDSQRQLRRVMAVTGVTALVAVAMGAMTFIALQARSEAQTLRQSGDAFIDELLTDGRQDLIAVGRLDVLDKFNQRALRFYESQGDPADLPADSLENWAGILHAIGEDEIKKEDANLDNALGIFQDAFAATEELLDRESHNPDRIYAHAQSTYWVGLIDEERGDYAAAEPHYEAYKRLAERLSETEPDSHRSAMELGHANLNLGILVMGLHRLSDAGEWADVAIAHFDKARDRRPEDRETQEALANAYAWRYNIHYDLSEFDRALETRRKGAEITRRIADRNPEDWDALFSLLIAERSIALTRCKLGDAQTALSQLSALRPQLARLVKFDPQNGHWSTFQGQVKNDINQVKQREICNDN